MSQMDFYNGLFDLSTHKIYPFYFATSFNVGYDASEHGYLRCSYTGDIYTGNGSYYFGYLYFYGVDDVRYSPYRPKDIEPKALSYYDQIYGYKEPVKFPEWAKNSIVHCVAWDCFGGNPYKLRSYVGKSLNIEKMKEIFGDKAALSSFGNTFNTPCYKGFLDCMHGKATLLQDYSKKQPDYVFTIGDLCVALNEILTPQRQLTLF